MGASEALRLADLEGVRVSVDPRTREVLYTPKNRASDRLLALLRESKAEILTSEEQPEREPIPIDRPTGGVPMRRRTALPDSFFDDVAPDLSDAELRCALYLLRRCYGFHRASDRISLSQWCRGIVTTQGRRLDKGTGLSMSAVTRALRGLERKGLITVKRGQGGKYGADTNEYGLGPVLLTPELLHERE